MPQLGVNDDRVLLVEWLVAPGSKVDHGQEIARLETTKAAMALVSESAGFIYPLVQSGQEFAVSEVIAVCVDQPDLHAASRYARSVRGQADSAGPDLGGRRVTEAARALIGESGIDPSRLPEGRIIRESDVRAILDPGPAAGVEAAGAPGSDPQRIVIYGASQGGLAVAEILDLQGKEVVAFIDDTWPEAGILSGFPVWPGGDFAELPSRGVEGVATHIADREFRLGLIKRVAALGLVLANAIHPRAIVSASVRMGAGNVIKAGAVIDADCRLGDSCIIDNGAIVPHHNHIGDACHLAPGVAMGGDCEIGRLTLIGIGATISARVRIGESVIVAPGSVVVRDIPDNVVVEGSPARVIGERRQSHADPGR
jgi:sugar O-acyltransferase (sialic acid O-acetyltransferase NeuD family)